MTAEMDWTTRLLYLTIIFGILILGAALLYIICYLTSRNDHVQESNTNSSAKTRLGREKIGNGEGGKSDFMGRITATGKQTMLSTLHKPATESDTILATAISAIPLKELGGKNADIIIDVAQQMCFNKDNLSHEEHHCIVCRARKEITWEEVSCFAQTTIGVLVYKRTLIDDGNRKGEQLINEQKCSPLTNATEPIIIADLQGS